MKILLTGGAGYVGSACLRWLLRHGHDVVAYDNLTEGNRSAVPDGRLIVGDILDTGALTKALRDHKAEALMHFAALAIVPDSVTDPSTYWHVNTTGTRSVLEAVRAAVVKKVLFSSTCASYDFTSPMPLTEESPQRPGCPYGTSKLAAELMLKDYASAYGFGLVLLRYFNAAGADPDGNFGEDRRHETHLLPLILQVAVGRRKELKVFGGDWETRDGTCERDYIHTDDLAEAHRLAVEAVQPGEQRIYNVGTGTGTTVLEALRACEAAAGKPIPYTVVGRRAGDPPILVAKSDKLRRELGWKPRYTSIEPIVASAWKWQSTHPNGYGDTKF